MWVGKLPEALAEVTALAYAPGGHTLYTGDSKGWVLAWDTATRGHRELYRRAKPAHGNRGVYDLWPTPDGARLLVCDDRTLVDAFRPEVGALLKPGEGEWGDWRYMLPDGKRVMSCEPDWRVGLWDLEAGKRLKVPGALGKMTDITYHRLLPDGVTLLTYQSAMGGRLLLWDLRTGKSAGEIASNVRGINPSDLSKDGTSFAVGRKDRLWVYDVPSRALRHRLDFEKEFRKLAFHPDGRLLASASTNSVVTLWDATAGKRLRQLDWKAGQVMSLAFAPDGLTGAAGCFEKFVVWDVDA